MSNSRIYYLIFILFFITSCETTGITPIPYKNDHSKYVNNIAILCNTKYPDMYLNMRTEDEIMSTIMAGPAIIPQIIMHTFYYFRRKDDTRLINSMMFDLNIGEILSEKLNTKLQLCSHFHVVPQESIGAGMTNWDLLEKKDKDVKDYREIGTELGADTIIEINVLSYGVDHIGFISQPQATLKIDVKMATASEGVVLWRDVIEAKAMIDMDLYEVYALQLEDIQLIKEKFEKVVDIVTEECIERLGFDTHYTYLIDKEFLKKAQHNIDLASQLGELNSLRHDSLITNVDYNEKKYELIERAKTRKTNINHEIAQNIPKNYNSVENIETNQIVLTKEQDDSKLPPLPRRD